jgi:hypothetical protein
LACLSWEEKRKRNSVLFSRMTKGTCHLCAAIARSLLEGTAGARPHNLRCPFGFTETTVPVRVGDRVIGFLATGSGLQRIDRIWKKFKKEAARFLSAGIALARKAERLWKQTRS